jgi:hypothetical protein
MINARGVIVAALASVAMLLLATNARANGNPQPDKPAWTFSCADVQKMVDDHGEAVVIALARRAGVPERVIQRARTSCRKRD